eukprot:gene9886-11601_t
MSLYRSYIPQVCSFLSDNELQDLYNEIDWFTVGENEVLFLQNEPADNYYLIGKGSVNLYYEEDDFVSASLSSGCHLGSFVGQLVRGQGFGEYALLANSLARSELQHAAKRTNKGKKQKASKERSFHPASRSCSAVSGSNDTLFFVINESVYNRIFKKHHHLQRQRAHCIHSLRKLPIFRHASLAKVTQVAFKTTKIKLPFKAMLGEYNAAINTVSIVMQGAVTVSARVEATADSLVLLDDAFHLDQSSIISSVMEIDVAGSIASVSVTSAGPPRPSIAVLRPGQMVGSVELNKGLNAFKFNYEVQSLSVEVLQIPAELYLQCAREAALINPNCANMTIFRQPMYESSVMSQEEPESQLVDDPSVHVESAAVGRDLPSEDGFGAMDVAQQNDSPILEITPQAAIHTSVATDVTAAVPSSKSTTTPSIISKSQHTPGKAARAVHSLLASPPSVSRPSKVQYRTTRIPISRSVVLPSATTTTTNMHSIAAQQAPLASGSVAFSSSFAPVFSPAPPVTTLKGSPRGVLTGSTANSPRRLGAGYVDIVDPLEGRYPTTSSGPCGGAGYFSTPAEAASAVSREMQAIRQRVREKQKGLGAALSY